MMRAYLMIAGNTVKSVFSYRAHALFQFLTNILAIFIQYYIWKAVFSAIPGGVDSGVIRGMTFRSTFLYVSLTSILFVFMRTWVEWDMNGMIRSGDVIMFLFKPVDFMSFMLSNSLGAMFGNLLLITVPGFVILFGVFDTGFVPGWNILFFALSLVGSCVLSFMIDFFIGATCFWTSSIWGISAAKDLIVAFLSGALIPLPFYPDALLSALRFLPFAYMYNLPVSIMVSPTPDVRGWTMGICIQLVWGVALYLGVRAYYSFSLKKLTVNGG